MINHKILETYIRNGFNILLQGKHGVGKTALLNQACESLGWNLKYYSASSLDPYTDLVGIPKFVENEDGTEVIKSIRPQEINDAEVVFFDELNRADPKVLNAVFELIQFRSINGEKLPNLKCVVAAQNPPDGEYTVDALDPALADRFQICLDIKPEVSLSYLKSVLNDETAEALVKWHKGHGKKADYISPRRIEYIGKVWEVTNDKASLAAAMPPNGTYDVGKLFNLLNNTALPEDLEALLVTDGSVKDVLRQLGGQHVLNIVRDAEPVHANTILNNVADALSVQFGPKTIIDYMNVIDEMTSNQIKRMTEGWTAGKKRQIADEREVLDHKGQNGVSVFKGVLGV